MKKGNEGRKFYKAKKKNDEKIEKVIEKVDEIKQKVEEKELALSEEKKEIKNNKRNFENEIILSDDESVTSKKKKGNEDNNDEEILKYLENLKISGDEKQEEKNEDENDEKKEEKNIVFNFDEVSQLQNLFSEKNNNENVSTVIQNDNFEEVIISNGNAKLVKEKEAKDEDQKEKNKINNLEFLDFLPETLGDDIFNNINPKNLEVIEKEKAEPKENSTENILNQNFGLDLILKKEEDKEDKRENKKQKKDSVYNKGYTLVEFNNTNNMGIEKENNKEPEIFNSLKKN